MRTRPFSGLLVAAVMALLVGVSPLVTPSAGAAEESWVTRSQVRLNELGCRSGHPDGVLDLHLRSAVIRFQAANHLRQSGRLTLVTRARLAAESAVACDQRPVPRASGSGRRIVVSQGQNWVWLVRRDGSVAGQGGMVDNDWLPQRTYSTGAQCGLPARSRYRSDLSGTLAIDRFVRFTDCIVGFHQIPVVRSTGRLVHPDWMVGTDLAESRGCIRLAVPTARALWRFTVEPTKVVVVG